MFSGGDGLVDQMWVVSKRFSGRPDVCCQVEMVWVTKCGLSVKDVLVDQMCAVRGRWSGRPDEGCHGDIFLLTDVESFISKPKH